MVGNKDPLTTVSMDHYNQGLEQERSVYDRDDPDLEENSRLVFKPYMSRAKRLIEFMCPAPAVEPKPGVKPTTEPGRPSQKPRPNHNPFRRRDIRPGEEPRPKARDTVESVVNSGANRLNEGKGKSLKQPSQGSAAPHAFSKAKKLITRSSGTGASSLSAKKAFKK